MEGHTTLSELSRKVVRAYRLNLKGQYVLTEAATGAFASTPSIAALAGATVFAVARSSRYGSRQRAFRESKAIANRLRVSSNIHFISEASQAPLEKIDIVTNSGHVRPIGKSLLTRLPQTSVISLMMEPWEVRPRDVNLSYAKRRKIAFAGTNEQGKKVNLFRHLGPLVVHILKKRGVRMKGKRIYLYSPSPFKKYIQRSVQTEKGRFTDDPTSADITILASGPHRSTPSRLLARLQKGSLVIQLWASLTSKRSAKLQWLPLQPPHPGHMGYLLSDLGPKPALELIAAGFKVGELLAQARKKGWSISRTVRYAVHSGFAQSSW